MEAKKFATYEDLLNVPDHMIGEIIAGELITAPRPGSEHANASSKLGRKVGGGFSMNLKSIFKKIFLFLI